MDVGKALHILQKHGTNATERKAHAAKGHGPDFLGNLLKGGMILTIFEDCPNPPAALNKDFDKVALGTRIQEALGYQEYITKKTTPGIADSSVDGQGRYMITYEMALDRYVKFNGDMGNTDLVDAISKDRSGYLDSFDKLPIVCGETTPRWECWSGKATAVCEGGEIRLQCTGLSLGERCYMRADEPDNEKPRAMLRPAENTAHNGGTPTSSLCAEGSCRPYKNEKSTDGYMMAKCYKFSFF